jgi:hypothetical protein
MLRTSRRASLQLAIWAYRIQQEAKSPTEKAFAIFNNPQSSIEDRNVAKKVLADSVPKTNLQRVWLMHDKNASTIDRLASAIALGKNVQPLFG